MARGFQADEAKEGQAVKRIGKAQRAADDTHLHMLYVIRAAIDDGVRAQVIADQLGVSRPTLYRMLDR
jgi:transcriptional regulator GlxA family with amidase domain